MSATFSRFWTGRDVKRIKVSFPSAGKPRETYLRDEITDLPYFLPRAKEHGGTPPCEVVSLLILIFYRNPFLISGPGPVNDCQTSVEKCSDGDGRGKRRKKDRRTNRGQKQPPLFHAHHPFYILISPLSRRPFKASTFCLSPSLLLTHTYTIIRLSFSTFLSLCPTRWHPFNIIMFPLCMVSFSAAQCVSLSYELFHPFVMV